VDTHVALVLTAAFTTVCWVITAYVTAPTDQAVLVDFYRKVRPIGPGWAPIAAVAGAHTVKDKNDSITLGLLGWVAGCSMIWSALFAVGNLLYGRQGYAITLTLTSVVSTAIVVWVMRQQWPDAEEE
jgi:hypothetical protein